jgi:hypothetical protein
MPPVSGESSQRGCLLLQLPPPPALLSISAYMRCLAAAARRHRSHAPHRCTSFLQAPGLSTGDGRCTLVWAHCPPPPPRLRSPLARGPTAVSRSGIVPSLLAPLRRDARPPVPVARPSVGIAAWHSRMPSLVSIHGGVRSHRAALFTRQVLCARVGSLRARSQQTCLGSAGRPSREHHRSRAPISPSSGLRTCPPGSGCAPRDRVRLDGNPAVFSRGNQESSRWYSPLSFPLFRPCILEPFLAPRRLRLLLPYLLLQLCPHFLPCLGFRCTPTFNPWPP